MDRNYGVTDHHGMASADASPRAGSARTRTFALWLTRSPRARSAHSDGSADFLKHHWLDDTGLSAEQARDWGWTIAGTTEPNANSRRGAFARKMDVGFFATPLASRYSKEESGFGANFHR
jgi:hypothetical protein